MRGREEGHVTNIITARPSMVFKMYRALRQFAATDSRPIYYAGPYEQGACSDAVEERSDDPGSRGFPFPQY